MDIESDDAGPPKLPAHMQKFTEAVHAHLNEYCDGYVLIGFKADSQELVKMTHVPDQKTNIALMASLNSFLFELNNAPPQPPL